MNIGEASRASRMSVKMIRYYESIGLIRTVQRTEAGHRRYEESDVQRLSFVRRARELSFPVAVIEELLALWDERTCQYCDVKRIIFDHVGSLEHKIAEMQTLVNTLHRLANSCSCANSQRCAIFDDLGGASRNSPVP